MRAILALTSLLFLFPVTPAPGAVVNAPIVCGLRDVVVGRLGSTYDEKVGAVGLANNGSKIEIYSSPGGTFTIIFTRPSGWTCVMVTGRYFEYLARPKCGVEI